MRLWYFCICKQRKLIQPKTLTQDHSHEILDLSRKHSQTCMMDKTNLIIKPGIEILILSRMALNACAFVVFEVTNIRHSYVKVMLLCKVAFMCDQKLMRLFSIKKAVSTGEQKKNNPLIGYWDR